MQYNKTKGDHDNLENIKQIENDTDDRRNKKIKNVDMNNADL